MVCHDMQSDVMSDVVASIALAGEQLNVAVGVMMIRWRVFMCSSRCIMYSSRKFVQSEKKKGK